MAYTTIDDPSAYFKVQLYTGTGSSNAQTFADTDTDMQPDMVWIKSRSDAFNHMLYDAARGVQKHIKPDSTAAEATDANSLTAFGSDGFTVGTNSDINNSSDTYAAWCWNTQGGAGSSNEAGTINSTTTSVGQTQGISISTYTGTNTAATIGHGLGAVPKMVIVKRTNGAAGWYVHHQNLTSANYHLVMNTAAVQGTGTGQWNDTLPTSTVFSVGTGSDTNGSSDTYVAYCFAPKQGFSKFGSYIGNGNADGNFVYLGFRPAFVLVKKATATDNWFLFDNKREGYNAINDALRPNLNNTELDLAGVGMDLLSNGFKLRSGDDDLNDSNTFIYMAFAEAPFVTGSGGVPCNAR